MNCRFTFQILTFCVLQFLRHVSLHVLGFTILALCFFGATVLTLCFFGFTLLVLCVFSCVGLYSYYVMFLWFYRS